MHNHQTYDNIFKAKDLTTILLSFKQHVKALKSLKNNGRYLSM